MPDVNYQQEWYRRNRERVRSQQAAYYEEHADEIKERTAEWQRTHPDRVADAQRRRRARHPEKTRARDAVAKALKRGKLVRQPCEVCGAPEAEAHHADHAKPLEIQWLCKPHHRAAEVS